MSTSSSSDSNSFLSCYGLALFSNYGFGFKVEFTRELQHKSQAHMLQNSIDISIIKGTFIVYTCIINCFLTAFPLTVSICYIIKLPS